MESTCIVLTGVGKAELRTEQLPDMPGPGEYLVKNDISLISAGTELSRVFAIKKGFSYPVYPGYASVGRVLAAGEGCDEGIAAGDLVYHAGPHRSLSLVRNTGTTQGLKVLPVAPLADPELAALLPLGIIAANGVHAADVQLGDCAAVFGLGAIGLFTALLLKERGAKLLALDPVEHRCALARSFGIETASVPPERQVETVREFSNGRGADLAVDVTGASPAILNAILATGKHGRTVLLGTPRASYSCDITPALNHIHMKMISVKGGFNELNPMHEVEGSRFSVERDYGYLRGFLAAHPALRGMVSHVVRPADIESAYHGLMYDKERYSCVEIDWRQL